MPNHTFALEKITSWVEEQSSRDIYHSIDSIAKKGGCVCVIEKQEIMSRKIDNLVSRVIALQCWQSWELWLGSWGYCRGLNSVCNFFFVVLVKRKPILSIYVKCSSLHILAIGYMFLFCACVLFTRNQSIHTASSKVVELIILETRISQSTEVCCKSWTTASIVSCQNVLLVCIT